MPRANIEAWDSGDGRSGDGGHRGRVVVNGKTGGTVGTGKAKEGMVVAMGAWAGGWGFLS